MPRIARIAVEAVPYHLTQRGNAKQKIFFADADYRMYLDLLRRYSTAHGLAVWAYCLMPNHVHLIVCRGKKRPWRRPWDAPTPSTPGIST